MPATKRDASAVEDSAGSPADVSKRARKEDVGESGSPGTAMAAAMSSEEALKQAEALKAQLEMLKAQKLAKKKAKNTKSKASSKANKSSTGEDAAQTAKRKAAEEEYRNDSQDQIADLQIAKKQRRESSGDQRHGAEAEVNTTSSDTIDASGSMAAPKPAVVSASVKNPYLAYFGDNVEDPDGAGESKAARNDNSTTDPYADDRLEDAQDRWKRKRALKQKRAFKIVPQGTFIEAANEQREQDLRREYAKNRRDMDKRRHFRQLLDGQRKSPTSTTQSLSAESKTESLNLVERPPPPAMEWWDQKLVSKRRMETILKKRDRAETAGDASLKSLSSSSSTMSSETSSAPAPTTGEISESDGPASNDTQSQAGAVSMAGDVEDEHDEGGKFCYEDLHIDAIRTLNLVQHPELVKSTVPTRPAPAIPLYLTKEERKRLRRQARREKQQELHDRIAAGLIPPPPPKVKMSNMMRVLGEQAVLDPSKMEAEVRRQTQERIRDHEMRNQANKLTPQEKWDKKLRKVAEDSQGAPEVAVYYVSELTQPATVAASNRFKMDANAQKLLLTGCAVIVPEPVDVGRGVMKTCNIVIVEGGPKRLRQFEKQMLQRIKWDPDGTTGNRCIKVWQGVVSAKAWPQRFEFQEFANAQDAREYLAARGVEHYWDTAIRSE